MQRKLILSLALVAGMGVEFVQGAGQSDDVAEEKGGRICSFWMQKGSLRSKVSPSIVEEVYTTYGYSSTARHTIYSLESAQALLRKNSQHSRLRDIVAVIVFTGDAEMLKKIQDFCIESGKESDYIDSLVSSMRSRLLRSRL